MRAVRRSAVSLLALIVVCFCYVQFQQRLLRFRAQHLLADFQAIRLHRSSWQDAQTLTRHWGAWGHYEGQCTWNDCRYEIRLRDAGSASAYLFGESLANRLVSLGIFKVYRWLGGRVANLDVAFIVQDGLIRRASTSINIESSWNLEGEKFFGSLIIYVKSRGTLNEAIGGGGWVLGNNAQLAQHPDFKVGRPSGCTSCLKAEVTYTPSLSQSEVVRLTSFDLSCLTRFQDCIMLEQLLPAARDWQLYSYPWGETHAENVTPQITIPASCTLPPVWTLGRDALFAESIETVSSEMKVIAPGDSREIAKVKLLEPLESSFPWSNGTLIDVFAVHDFLKAASHGSRLLESGKRYLLFVNEPIRGKNAEVAVDACSVIEDTPENRAAIRKGVAERDPLRGNELEGGAW